MGQSPTPLQLEPRKRRPWRGHVLACCGDCGPMDCVSCALGCNAPWIAYSWNAHKVLQRSFWREAGILIALSVTMFVFYEAAAISIPFTCQQALDSHGVAYCEAINKGAVIVCVLLALAALGTWVAYGVHLGGRRRLLRERLDIEQGGCNDVAAHMFCNACAIVQETRTIMHMEAEGALARKLMGEAASHLLAPLNDDGMDRDAL